VVRLKSCLTQPPSASRKAHPSLVLGAQVCGQRDNIDIYGYAHTRCTHCGSHDRDVTQRIDIGDRFANLLPADNEGAHEIAMRRWLGVFHSQMTSRPAVRARGARS
jgi:5-methylcytosine-specific restriction endonuclease McrA